MDELSFRHKQETIYTEASSIPESFRLPGPLIQNEYLVNGCILIWEGERQPVISPVRVRTANGIEQVVIGEYPLMTEKEALAGP
jgi:glyceraldehyde-3-phosphate dehydrogenase (NADP+)